MFKALRNFAATIGLLPKVEPEPVVIAEDQQHEAPQNTEPITVHLKVKHFDMKNDTQWRHVHECPLAMALAELYPEWYVSVRTDSATIGEGYYVIEGEYTEQMYQTDYKRIKRFKDKNPLRVVRTFTLVPK